MAQKKRGGAKKAVSKKKPVAKKVARKAKVTASSKTRNSKTKPARKAEPAAKKKASSPASRSAANAKKEPRSPEPSTLAGRTFRRGAGKQARGVGSASAGQAGDLQGLSRRARADSESVEELIEEGQSYEAGIIEAVEDARDPDQGELQTREVPEDDVPEEYLDED